MRILIALISINMLFANEDLIQKATEAKLVPLAIKKDIFENKSQLELGKKLYFEPRLAESNLISCNSCHNLALGGSNAIPTTKPFNSNVPTIFNATFDEEFAKTHLMTHITGSLNASKNSNAKEQVVAKITAFPQYVIEFKKSYGNNVKIDFDFIKDAIIAFQSTLTTQSRYDDFLRGNFKALSKKEQEGLEIFINKGCVECHNGVNLGGEILPYSKISEYKFASDFKKDSTIKVPILRNITQSAPYLKSGKLTSLKETIKTMTKTSISDNEAEKIEEFFESLSGKKPNITYPQLPM